MPKYKTISIDSVGELARLYFSKDMNKSSSDMEKIRAMNNYPGATERLNMLVRALKGKRDSGIEIVFTAHEDIEKVYAKGGGMASKGGPAPEPIAVKGWPDIPGKRAPDEFCRACDNVLRVRHFNNSTAWISRREAIGVGADYWEVKDRFNGPALFNNTGILPPDYNAVKAECVRNNPEWWQAPYIWMIYGPYGIGKTRSLLTFPGPQLCINLDHGTKSLTKTEIERAQMTIVDAIDVEESDDYNKFVSLIQGA
jgi:hypothetical protein